MLQLLGLGVDGVMTAEPARLERVLCEQGVARPPRPPGIPGKHCNYRRASIACDVFAQGQAQLYSKGLRFEVVREDDFPGRCAGRVALMHSAGQRRRTFRLRGAAARRGWSRRVAGRDSAVPPGTAAPPPAGLDHARGDAVGRLPAAHDPESLGRSSRHESELRKRPPMPNQSGMAEIPRYRGPFREKQAARLLWRAGFGPKPGEARRLARKGLNGAVASLLDPPKARLVGSAPVDGDGLPIAPYDLWGHDALWWLDKMVRSNQPLVERMALNWHDWFATGDVGSQRHSIEQAQLFRKRALGSFEKLLLEVTHDKAMLVWLSGHRQQPLVAERELRARADGAVHARRLGRIRLPVLRGRRPRAGAGADRLARRLGGRRRAHQLPLRPRIPRRRHQDGVRQAGPVRLARLMPALPRAPGPRGLLRRQALELLRRRSPRPGHALEADPPLQAQGLRGEAAAGGDPEAPVVLRGPGDGEAADRVHRGHAQGARSRRRHRQLELGLRPRRPAPVQPAERGGLGRGAVARHVELSRPLDRRHAT